ncbi:RNA-guided endonuclease IscB [Chamaesiphon sp.]|uniref:RNA-guided endonuclease IscB n=1 Tax=Chamaesiphon sp. TaxID=2814140 RepID=UPI003592EF21
MSNFVFLIDANKTPMNPIHPAHARELMEQGKAAVFRMFPSTLIMKRIVDKIITYPLSLRIDLGSKFTGISLVNNRDEAIWGMELQHRGLAIKDALETRKAVRRSRRARHTRYRQARFLNRERPAGWLAPSLMHRILTVGTWVKRLIKYSPVAEIRQELVRFDLQKLENPEISGVEYQQGELLGYEVREYLLNKWDRKCSYCEIKGVPLQVEHVIPKAKGGSNRISNLCLACDKCNKKKGTLALKEFLSGKPQLLNKIQSQLKAPLKDAAAVNSTRWAFFDRLKLTGLPVSTGSGGLTKFNRTRLGLPKTDWLDAACVGVVDTLQVLTFKILSVKVTGHGCRRMTRIDKYGFPCTEAKQTFSHISTGDFVKATIQKNRKNVRAGTYTGRVKTPTPKGCEVVINGFRVAFSSMQDLKIIHHNDGFSYA